MWCQDCLLTTDGHHPEFTVAFLVPGGGENQRVPGLWGQLRELTDHSQAHGKTHRGQPALTWGIGSPTRRGGISEGW